MPGTDATIKVTGGEDDFVFGILHTVMLFCNNTGSSANEYGDSHSNAHGNTTAIISTNNILYYSDFLGIFF